MTIQVIDIFEIIIFCKKCLFGQIVGGVNMANVVKANECISLYKPFRSEDLGIVMTDTCKEKKLFIKHFVLDH